jgi:hypothetical protein
VKHPVTPDGRYFVVCGRLWRMANPGLGEAERADLVDQLMVARRAVGGARKAAIRTARLDSDRLTARAAAELMAITLRQTYRLLRRYRDGGASAIANQRRGRPSNNRLPDVVRDHAIALVRERYALDVPR